MDNLIYEGVINEMIVVIPNGLTFMLGGFYVNSPVRGNWEDYIIEDLIGYIDNNFSTIPNTAFVALWSIKNKIIMKKLYLLNFK